VFKKMCGPVACCLLLFPLTYCVASSAVKYFTKQEVKMERVEVNDRQYELQKALKELTKYVKKNERKTLFFHLDITT
jgi:hypothetical protein